MCPITEAAILGQVVLTTFLPTRLIFVVFSSGGKATFTGARAVKCEGITSLSTKSGSFSLWPIRALDELKVRPYDVVIVICRGKSA